jgi:hypothetical protein
VGHEEGGVFECESYSMDGKGRPSSVQKQSPG